MELKQVSIGELAAFASGAPRFLVKFMPTATLRQELHTEVSREIRLFWLADDTDTFVVHNRFVGGGDWSEELGDYTDEIWETIILRASVDIFEKVANGHDSTGRFEWPGGSMAWNAVAVEPRVENEAPVTVAVGGAVTYSTCLDETLRELLVELELVGSSNQWRLSRSAMGPAVFTLARHDPDSEALR